MASLADDAQDYVESIMPSQRPTKVDTPSTGRRKRHLSVPSGGESTLKKARSVNTDNRREDRSPRVAKRSLYRPAEGSQTPSSNETLEQLIRKLSSDVQSMHQSLSDRIDKLEAGLEQKIASKVSQLLDKRVNAEMGRIRKEVDSRIDDIKTTIQAELSSEVEAMNEKISSLNISANNDRSDIELNIVIRNLPESNNESTTQKVNSLLREGLKLPNVSVDKAERKNSQDQRKPGVVVARFKTTEDKKQVMAAKRRLKSSRQYSDVYINNDQLKHDRLMASNFRAILSALKRRDVSLSMRGARVVTDQHNNNEREHSNSTDNSRADYERRRGDGWSRVPNRRENNGGRQQTDRRDRDRRF